MDCKLESKRTLLRSFKENKDEFEVDKSKIIKIRKEG